MSYKEEEIVYEISRDGKLQKPMRVTKLVTDFYNKYTYMKLTSYKGYMK